MLIILKTTKLIVSLFCRLERLMSQGSQIFRHPMKSAELKQWDYSSQSTKMFLSKPGTSLYSALPLVQLSITFVIGCFEEHDFSFFQ